MKYQFILLFILFSFSSFSQSTEFTFKMGSEFIIPWSTQDLAFVGNEKEGIVNILLDKKKLNIIRFDHQTLLQIKESTIELKGLARNYNSETLINSGGNYFWLHSEWDKVAEKEILYADKIDIVEGIITESNKKLLEASRIAGVYENTNSGLSLLKYNYKFDAAHKRLLVTYRLIPEIRNNKENYDKLGFYVFDEHMNKIWGSEFSMPYTEAISDNSDFSVDSEGNAYLLAKIYDSEKRREKDKETGLPAYHFEVFKFMKGTKKIIIIPVAQDNNYIQEASIVEGIHHEIIIACTYSKKSKGKGTDGIFLAILNVNNKIDKYMNGYYEFPLDELTKFESEKSKRKMEDKDDYEVPNLKFRDLNVMDDGSVFISCEEFHIRHNASSPGVKGNLYTWYYDNIIAAKINASGQLEWVRKIPKKQKTISAEGIYSKGNPFKGTMGFKLVSNLNGYYFLYMDNKKNLGLKDNEVPQLHLDDYGGQVMVAKLSQSGILTKELLFDIKDEDVMLFPSSFSKINANQFIGRAKLKKFITYKPLLITVN